MQEYSPLMKSIRMNELTQDIAFIDRQIAHIEREKLEGLASQLPHTTIAKLQKQRDKKSREALDITGPQI